MMSTPQQVVCGKQATFEEQVETNTRVESCKDLPNEPFNETLDPVRSGHMNNVGAIPNRSDA